MSHDVAPGAASRAASVLLSAPLKGVAREAVTGERGCRRGVIVEIWDGKPISTFYDHHRGTFNFEQFASRMVPAPAAFMLRCLGR